MTPPDRRGYLLALALLTAGAGLLFLGYGQTWATAVAVQPGLPTVTVAFSGRDLAALGASGAVLALAGIAGLAATRSTGRIVTGVVLVLGGLVSLVPALLFGTGVGREAEMVREVSEKVGVDVDPVLTVTAWWAVALLGGLVVAIAGVLAIVRGGRWPAMSTRYERADARATRGSGRAGDGSAWERLDRGEDPTLDDAATPSADQGAPVGTGPDTMAPTAAEEDDR